LATRANEGLTPSRWGLHLAALGLAMIAGSLKADIVLIGAAFPAVALIAERRGIRQWLFAIATPLSIVAAPLLLHAMFIAPVHVPAPVSYDSTGSWTERFPLVPSYFVSRENLKIMATSTGLVIAVTMLAGGLKS